MSETAVAVRTVTAEELDLVKRTVANGATDAELKLFLFDCQRQGVHPLDRLIHFTKRSGKYTPITSIDFMRIRAADSGEMAGSDEPVFAPRGSETPMEATVTVYRMTQGHRFAYTATARWSEYKPEPGASGNGDIMWRKMPHTMLGKCAEALALRKGFPRQLAGLYAKEEMDQAEAQTVNTPDRIGGHAQGDAAEGPTSRRHDAIQGENPATAPSDEGPDLEVDLPPGARFIRSVNPGSHGAACEIEFTNGERCLSWNRKLPDQAAEWSRNRVAVFPEYKISATGNKRIEHLVPVPVAYHPDAPEEAF